MKETPFVFELYRLNIVDDHDYLDFMGKSISSDEDILAVVQTASLTKCDTNTKTKTKEYQWSIRDVGIFVDLQDRTVVRFSFSRSLLSQTGDTVTDEKVESTILISSPPSAHSMTILYYPNRHIVCIERNSYVMTSHAWLKALHSIFDNASKQLDLRSLLRLEPIPQEAEVLTAFRSFDIVTRLRVRLRVPNPDLAPGFDELYRLMQDSRIRELTQDMRNRKGLSQEAGRLPSAAVEMAQAGYKEGDVSITGLKNGKRVTTKVGDKAMRGEVAGLKEYIRGMRDGAKSQEARTKLAIVYSEVERRLTSSIVEDSSPSIMGDEDVT